MRRYFQSIFNEPAEHGFSLLELIVVMTIMGVVLAISMPALSDWRENAVFKGDARKLLGALQHARIEAVKRNVFCSVTFDQVVSGTTYDYVVFIDEDNDRVLDAGEIDDILHRGTYDNAVKDPDEATPVTFSDNGAGNRAAIFNSRGLPMNQLAGSGFIVGSVRLQAPSGLERLIAVSNAGRIQITIP